MAKTPRFALTYGGLSELQDLAFTNGDRLAIDKLLAAFEAHAHEGGTRLADPGAAPALTLDTASGQLASGTTYYYVVTYIDQYGLESAPSAEASVTTGATVAIPQGPALTASAGGTLATGLYQYALTAIKGTGETPLSSIATITLTDFNTVNVAIPGGLPTGADSISIWRKGPTEGWFTRIATQGDATTFVDDGSIPASALACLPQNQPPLINTTQSTNQVTIDAPTGELVQPTLAKRWRIYRSTTAGVYNQQSLLADISDTTTEGGTQLVETYVDDGTATLATGSPPTTSRTLEPSAALASEQLGRTLMLRDTGGTVWKITADRSGQLVTTALSTLEGITATAFADDGFGLVDSGATGWRVTVTTTGQLVTTSGTDVSEVLFGYGQGPDLRTPDPASTVRLGVTTAGELQTVGDVGEQGEPYRIPAAITGASYTLATTDAQAYRRFTGDSLVTVTVPPASAEPFKMGEWVSCRAVGAAGLTLDDGADPDVTLLGNTTCGQHETIVAVYVGDGIWELTGGTSP